MSTMEMSMELEKHRDSVLHFLYVYFFKDCLCLLKNSLSEYELVNLRMISNTIYSTK